MNDNDSKFVKLPKTLYDLIEFKVVELFEQLNIDKFPIDPFQIANSLNIKLIPYSQLSEKAQQYYHSLEVVGFNCILDGVRVICYNDNDIIERQRFTIMHEIGHIVMKHKQDSELAEKIADYFASYALAPSPMIGRLNCVNYIDISKTFFVSKECSEIILIRFENWCKFSGYLKPYELKLNEMFV